MLTILRRWFAKVRRKSEPEDDLDLTVIPPHLTRDSRYWSRRDARFRKPGEDRDGFAPRGWRI